MKGKRNRFSNHQNRFVIQQEFISVQGHFTLRRFSFYIYQRRSSNHFFPPSNCIMQPLHAAIRGHYSRSGWSQRSNELYLKLSWLRCPDLRPPYTMVHVHRAAAQRHAHARTHTHKLYFYDSNIHRKKDPLLDTRLQRNKHKTSVITCAVMQLAS